MDSKIKIIIDNDSALCDISGDKIEITAMLVRLFTRQPHLIDLFKVALSATEFIDDLGIKNPFRNDAEKGEKPPENEKTQQSDSEQEKKES